MVCLCPDILESHTTARHVATTIDDHDLLVDK